MDDNILKQMFEYKEGNLIWKKRPRSDFKTEAGCNITNGQKAGKVAGCDNGSGYIVVGIKGRLYYLHRLIWIYHNGPILRSQIIDHKNMDTLNNSIENLRLANKSKNGMNRNKPANNTSGYKGICWYETRKVWVVQVVGGGKKISKHFKDKKLAIEFALRTQKELHQEFIPD